MKVLIIQSMTSKKEKDQEVLDNIRKQLHDGLGVVMIPVTHALVKVVEDPVDICFEETPNFSNHIMVGET